MTREKKERKDFSDRGFRPLAGNPALLAIKRDLVQKNQKAADARRARNLREKLDAPALDLRSKFKLPPIKPKGEV